MKSKEILAIIEGIIDRTWGMGTLDSILESILEDKSLDEIMLELCEKKRIKNPARTDKEGE